MVTKADNERFQSGANKYAAYLETPEGRLRLGLGLRQPAGISSADRPNSHCALWILGVARERSGLRLARLGIHVTLLDSSPAMLDIAQRAAHEAGVTEKIEMKHGDADQSGELISRCIVRCNSLP